MFAVGKTEGLYSYSSEIINHLKEELQAYLAHVANTSADISPLEWWKRNASDLPHWAEATRTILLLQPSSAAAESFCKIPLVNSKTIHHRTTSNVH